jgi:YVTN family beta-propeller protein
VANAYDDTVSVIATARNTVRTTVHVGSGPQGIALAPDGTRVYTANQFDNTVSVIGTARNTLQATVPIGAYPQGIALTPDGALAYTPNADDNAVSVIDTARNSVTATVHVGRFPASFGLFIGPTLRQRIEWVIAQLSRASIKSEVLRSLLSKLAAAIDALEDGHANIAVDNLRAFRREVSDDRRDRKIPDALAGAMISLVDAIIANLPRP